MVKSGRVLQNNKMLFQVAGFNLGQIKIEW